jgi:uncharacterized protein
MRLSVRPLLKPLLCTAIAIALSGAALARDVAQASPSAEAKAPPVPLLWRVSDADNSVYLLGSFHLLEPTDYPLSRDVDAAFADAESVVFELPPEEMASPQLGVRMGQAALRSDGTVLDDELPADTAARLAAWAATSGMNASMLQTFEPWFVALMVTIHELTRMGFDPQLGLDAHIAGLAARAQKPTSGLETGAEQIAFLDGMGREEQVQFLQEALEQTGEGAGEMRELHAAWRRGDAAAMWDGMVLDMRERYPDLYRRINVERNDRWVPELEQRLRSAGTDDTLVVVGALHLLGEDGVVEKLRARGYEVERICSACDAGPASSAP